MAISDLVGGGIKSVQRGEVDVSSGLTDVNVSVSAVNMSKSFVNIPGSKTSNASGLDTAFVSVKLTSTTNLQFSRITGVNGVIVSWELVEFY